MLSFSDIKRSPGEHGGTCTAVPRGARGLHSRVFSSCTSACSETRSDWCPGRSPASQPVLLGWIPVAQDGGTDIDQLNGF